MAEAKGDYGRSERRLWGRPKAEMTKAKGGDGGSEVTSTSMVRLHEPATNLGRPSMHEIRG